MLRTLQECCHDRQRSFANALDRKRCERPGLIMRNRGRHTSNRRYPFRLVAVELLIHFDFRPSTTEQQIVLAHPTIN